MQLPKKKILLVGTGQMSRDYFNVLKSMKMQMQTEVVCRSAKSAKDFKKDTGHDAISGGLKKYLDDN